MQRVHVSTDLIKGGWSHQNQQLNQPDHQDQQDSSWTERHQFGEDTKTHEIWM